MKLRREKRRLMVDKFIGSVLKLQQPGDERGQAWNLSQKHISSFSVREDVIKKTGKKQSG